MSIKVAGTPMQLPTMKTSTKLQEVQGARSCKLPPKGTYVGIHTYGTYFLNSPRRRQAPRCWCRSGIKSTNDNLTTPKHIV